MSEHINTWKRRLNAKLNLESIHFIPSTEEEVNRVQDAMGRNLAHQARGCYNFKKSLQAGGDPILAELPCGFFMVTKEEIIPMTEHFKRLAYGKVQN